MSNVANPYVLLVQTAARQWVLFSGGTPQAGGFKLLRGEAGSRMAQTDAAQLLSEKTQQEISWDVVNYVGKLTHDNETYSLLLAKLPAKADFGPGSLIAERGQLTTMIATGGITETLTLAALQVLHAMQVKGKL